MHKIFIIFLLLLANVSATVENGNCSLSLLLHVFYDTDMLLEILRLYRSIAQEVVVMDGWRQNSTEILNILGLQYQEHNSPVKAFFDTVIRTEFPHLRVIYRYKIWDDEGEQRNVGYHLATCEHVYAMEGDMFGYIDPARLLEFYNSREHVVASVYTINIIYDSFTMGGGRFPVIAKKNKLTAPDFFNWLWIVGIDRPPPQQSQLFFPYIGYTEHYTLARTRINMIAKYAFYKTAGGHKVNLELFDKISKRYGKEIAREIFLRDLLESGTCLSSNAILKPYSDLMSVGPLQRKDFLCDFTYFSRPIPLVANISSWSRLHSPYANSHCLLFKNVKSCRISIHDYIVRLRPQLVFRHEYTEDALKHPLTIKIHSKKLRRHEPFLAVIEFLCDIHNGQDDFIGYVENVRCNKGFYEEGSKQ